MNQQTSEAKEDGSNLANLRCSFSFAKIIVASFATHFDVLKRPIGHMLIHFAKTAVPQAFFCRRVTQESRHGRHRKLCVNLHVGTVHWSTQAAS
jgi:hypothetical protein